MSIVILLYLYVLTVVFYVRACKKKHSKVASIDWRVSFLASKVALDGITKLTIEDRRWTLERAVRQHIVVAPSINFLRRYDVALFQLVLPKLRKQWQTMAPTRNTTF